MEGKPWLVQCVLKLLNVFPSEIVETWRDVWKETEEDTGKVKWAPGQTTFQPAPSSFRSSTSAGSEPGQFTFEKLFFIVLMKIHHGSNGKKNTLNRPLTRNMGGREDSLSVKFDKY